MLICIYEDRPSHESGLKLLLLTLRRHCPDWPVRLTFPGISPSLSRWLARYWDGDLQDKRLTSSGSYNVKPQVLLDGLSTGSHSCLWLDTDVMVNGSLEFIEDISLDVIVVAQDPWEYAEGSTHRCGTWGLRSGRSLRGPLNSAIIRVTQHHEKLLKAWEGMLESGQYLQEQAKPVMRRNQHMLGDQDALSALLASEDFSSLPLRRLAHSTEILQHHGAAAYGPVQRWLNIIHGMPPLIHAMGTVKPWNMAERPHLFRSPRNYYERAYLELSPYVHSAREYRSALEGKVGWLNIHTWYGAAGTLLAFNRPLFKGVLQATLHRTIVAR